MINSPMQMKFIKGVVNAKEATFTNNVAGESNDIKELSQTSGVRTKDAYFILML